MIQAEIGDVILIIPKNTFDNRYIIGEIQAMNNRFISLREAIEFRGFSFAVLKDFASHKAFQDSLFAKYDERDFGHPYVSEIGEINLNWAIVNEVVPHPEGFRGTKTADPIQAILQASQIMGRSDAFPPEVEVGSTIQIDIGGDIYQGTVGNKLHNLVPFVDASRIYVSNNRIVTEKVPNFWLHWASVRYFYITHRKEG